MSSWSAQITMHVHLLITNAHPSPEAATWMEDSKQMNHERDRRKLETREKYLPSRQLSTQTFSCFCETEDSSQIYQNSCNGKSNAKQYIAMLLDNMPSSVLERCHQDDKNAHRKDLVSETCEQNMVRICRVFSSRLFHTHQTSARDLNDRWNRIWSNEESQDDFRLEKWVFVPQSGDQRWKNRVDARCEKYRGCDDEEVLEDEVY